MNPTSNKLELSEVERLKTELRGMKRELDVTHMERDILKNSRHLLEGSTSMKYKEIQLLSAEFPVSRLCSTLAVRETSYYAWLQREPSARPIENTSLLKQIEYLWHRFRGIYGAPRIWAELVACSVKVGLKRVA